MTSRPDLEALLLRSGDRRLFSAYHSCSDDRARRGGVLIVPAFGEEMNRCRSMVSLQARALASAGFGALVLDLSGTGDSAGDFAEADWENWQEDLAAGIEWLARRHGKRVVLLGVRVGALLAAQLAERHSEVCRLVFWQPVLSGRGYLTSLMRLRIAADMHDANGMKSTDAIRSQWSAGNPVEISGYQISSALASSLEKLELEDVCRRRDLPVTWFEVLPSQDASVPRGAAKLAARWSEEGRDVHLAKVVGAPFWQVHERELAPELLEATSEAFAPRDDETPALGSEASVQFDASESSEQPITFSCESDVLVGVVHRNREIPSTRVGVIIVVAGGPQYRAGAHRQFVSLARHLAQQGHTVLRFDLRGMGDSSGPYRGYLHSREDIKAAVDTLLHLEPALFQVVLFGECESASGAIFYGWSDRRVGAMILVNPWVRTDEGQAQVIVKHYYGQRLISKEFWSKVLAGRFNWRESWRSFLDVVAAYRRGRSLFAKALADADVDMETLPLPERTAAGLRRFEGPVLLLMSGRDYIAREFDEVTASSQAWIGVLDGDRVTRVDLEEADHTFSRKEWKTRVAVLVGEWLDNLKSSAHGATNRATDPTRDPILSR